MNKFIANFIAYPFLLITAVLICGIGLLFSMTLMAFTPDDEIDSVEHIVSVAMVYIIGVAIQWIIYLVLTS